MVNQAVTRMFYTLEGEKRVEIKRIVSRWMKGDEAMAKIELMDGKIEDIHEHCIEGQKNEKYKGFNVSSGQWVYLCLNGHPPVWMSRAQVKNLIKSLLEQL